MKDSRTESPNKHKCKAQIHSFISNAFTVVRMNKTSAKIHTYIQSMVTVFDTPSLYPFSFSGASSI